MLLLVASVEVGVIGFAGLKHFPKDFQKPLTQAAQGASVAFAFGAFLPVVDLGPRAHPNATLSPKMDGMAQDLVTLVADTDPMDLTRLKTNWGGAGDALQALRILEAVR